jgi:hypothetical protein
VRELGVDLGFDRWAGLLGSTESATSASNLGGRSVLGPTELGGLVVGGPVCWVRERERELGRPVCERAGSQSGRRSVGRSAGSDRARRVGRRETRSIWATSEIRCRSVRELGVDLGADQWAGLLGSTARATSASDLGSQSVLGPTERELGVGSTGFERL